MTATTKTIENMLTAYKGERSANAKYQAFSKKAEQEGLHDIAILYNAVAAAENIHANNHKIVLQDAGQQIPSVTPDFSVKSTKENLANDIKDEAYEGKTMYPDFLKTAETANNQTAVLSLSYAMRTEIKHKLYFENALSDIANRKLGNLPTIYFVCPACGNTYANLTPKHCDFSLTPKEDFIVFE